MTKIYFPNLNGIRFIAAFLVIIHHTEQLKHVFGLPNFWHVPFVMVIGKLGVVLFFVLSGFLITYLLLEEEAKTGSISLKDFYIRRMLRIWPLYYLMVLLGFFLLPAIPFLNLRDLSVYNIEHFGTKLAMFLFLLPNLAIVVFTPVPFISQAWSVGVEEQFYLIWPILLRWCKNKELLLYGVIVVYLGLRFGLKAITGGNDAPIFLEVAFDLWKTFSIDCMAIGGIFALYLYRKTRLLNLLYNKYLQWAVVLCLAVLIVFGVKLTYFHNEFYAILFGVLILNLAANPQTVIRLENPVLHYLGRISYGLYMFHIAGIVVALKGLNALGLNNLVLQYLVSLLLTVLLAAVSYRYFEKFFIRKKTKYSKIVSGENAH